MNKDSFSLTNAISYEIIDACVSVEQALTNYNNKQMTLCENGAPYDECYCIDTTNIDEFMCNEYDEIIRNLSNDEIVEESFKDVISAIVNGIKRAIRWIVTSFKRLLGKVFGNKKKAKKTANQIAAEIIKTTVQESGDDTSKYYKQKIINIRFKDEKNQLREIPVTFFDKKLNIEIDGNGYIIHPKGIGKLNTPNLEVGKRLLDDDELDFMMQFDKFMTDKQLRSYFAEFIKSCGSDPDNINNDILDKTTAALNALTNIKPHQIRINHAILQEWISTLNIFYKNLISVDSIYFGKLFKNDRVKTLFYYTKDLFSKLTIASNLISSELTGLFLVDSKFENSINDINTLSLFVDGMINSGIPSSYVGYNTWFVMSKQFKDSDVFIDLNNNSTVPAWGHSRIVFYPPENGDTKVMKVALSSHGIASNKREMQLTNAYKNLNIRLEDGRPLVEILAKTEAISKNGCITVCERIIPCKNGSEAFELEKIVQSIPAKINKALSITDIHSGNIGYTFTKNGNIWKILDYGDSIIK